MFDDCQVKNNLTKDSKISPDEVLSSKSSDRDLLKIIFFV